MLWIMKVGDEQAFVAFDLKEAAPGHLPHAGDICCSVEALCGGFRGRVESAWFSREDVARFLTQLQRLEQTRQGSASLSNLSSASDHSPLGFEIFSTDGAGHLAVRADLLKVSYVGDTLSPLRVSVSFPLGGGDLPSALAGFRRLFANK